MFRPIALVAAVLVASQALASPASPLVGVWIEVDGPGKARIAPCADAADRLCAIGLAQRAGTTVETGLVLSNIREAGISRWQGTYHDNKRHLPATLRLLDQRRVEMKVCVFILCQTATYTRG